MIIEIATSDLLTTDAAIEGGADRIELCANLGEGGTTPSFGLIKKVREKYAIPLYVMIRPRGGDFLYNKDEKDIMLEDIRRCKELGCDGVVFGILLHDGNIDVESCKKLADAAYPMGITFHRAFDRCRDPFEALEQIIGLGIERILSSGQAPTAPEGIPMLKELIQKADNRIVIMPGAGVTPDTIGTLASELGCDEFHGSLRTMVESSMKFVHPSFQGSAESYMNNAINPDAVRALRSSLDKVAKQEIIN